MPPARRQRLHVRRHRRAVHEKAQADDEAREDRHRDRSPGRDQLRGENLRRAGENQRRHSQRFEGDAPAACAADAADQAERQQADERRRHVAGAGDEIRTGEVHGQGAVAKARRTSGNRTRPLLRPSLDSAHATTLVCASPASTMRFCPVMPRASSEARNNAVRATSSSDSRNLRHCCSRNCRSCLGRQPQRALPLGGDRAGDDAVDADVARAELARERAREPVDRRLRRRVAGKLGTAAHPRHRAQVDDRAAAGARHLRRDRLRREELVAQVHRLVVVPVFGSDVVELVPVVARCVVDEHADRSECSGALPRWRP